MDADSLKLFYEESKSAHEGITELLKQYRSNTTAVLTLATGAATFFGFANSPKGVFYILALAAYAVAVLAAASIYLPVGWRVNVAESAGEELTKPPLLTPSKLTYDLGVRYQDAIDENAGKISGPIGVAARFTALIAAAALVVILAGINTVVVKNQPAPQITKVQIVKG